MPYVRSRLASLTTLAPAAAHPEGISRPGQVVTHGSAAATDGRTSASIIEPALAQSSASSRKRAGPASDPRPLVPIPLALPTRLVIPAISVDAPIVPVAQRLVRIGGASLAMSRAPTSYAAGWHRDSAPLGLAGNTVLNGHNANYGEIFRDLYTLEAGDIIVVYSGDVPYVHTVSNVFILREAGQSLETRRRNARHIEPTDDERLTLVTCHPYGSLRYRLIVLAQPGVSISGRSTGRVPSER